MMKTFVRNNIFSSSRDFINDLIFREKTNDKLSKTFHKLITIKTYYEAHIIGFHNTQVLLIQL